LGLVFIEFWHLTPFYVLCHLRSFVLTFCLFLDPFLRQQFGSLFFPVSKTSLPFLSDPLKKFWGWSHSGPLFLFFSPFLTFYFLSQLTVHFSPLLHFFCLHFWLQQGLIFSCFFPFSLFVLVVGLNFLPENLMVLASSLCLRRFFFQPVQLDPSSIRSFAHSLTFQFPPQKALPQKTHTLRSIPRPCCLASRYAEWFVLRIH